MWFIWLSREPDVHAIWHLAYPWPAGGWHVNETKRRADLPQWRRQDITMTWIRCHGYDGTVTMPWDQHDKTVARASKRAMLGTMGRRNSIHRRLCNIGTRTSVTSEGPADVVLATFSTETAAQITRSVLQQTTRRHMRQG